jgi:polysaccharide export outer membrane protein
LPPRENAGWKYWNMTRISNPRGVAGTVFTTIILGTVVMAAPAARQAPPAGTATAQPALSTSSQSERDVEPGLSGPWTGGRYRLTPTDVLEIRFPNVPEFDQIVTLQPDGYVTLRWIGDVRVQGRTLSEARTLIAERYADLVKDPVVDIVLKEFEKPYVMVAGEVAHPGKYDLRGATTLTEALTVAGGYNSSAKHSQVVLFRRFMADWLEVKQYDVKKMYASRNLSEDPVLRPGDTIFVPKSALAKIEPFIPRPSIGLFINPFGL